MTGSSSSINETSFFNRLLFNSVNHLLVQQSQWITVLVVDEDGSADRQMVLPNAVRVTDGEPRFVRLL